MWTDNVQSMQDTEFFVNTAKRKNKRHRITIDDRISQ